MGTQVDEYGYFFHPLRNHPKNFYLMGAAAGSDGFVTFRVSAFFLYYWNQVTSCPCYFSVSCAVLLRWLKASARSSSSVLSLGLLVMVLREANFDDLEEASLCGISQQLQAIDLDQAIFKLFL